MKDPKGGMRPRPLLAPLGSIHGCDVMFVCSQMNCEIGKTMLGEKCLKKS